MDKSRISIVSIRIQNNRCVMRNESWRSMIVHAFQTRYWF